MYLSRLVLNLRHRQVRTDLARPYDMHRTLLRAFPDDLPKDVDRLLYRIEQGTRRPEPLVLAQSHLTPDWSNLPEGYLAAIPDAPNPAVKDIELNLQAGATLAFRLLANPTKRLSRSLPHGREKSQRVGLFRTEEQLDWLVRKGAHHGFQILTAVATRPERQTDRNLTLQTVQFDGLLTVTDPTQLVAAVAQGIGSAKAFGCGLLSLARPRQ